MFSAKDDTALIKIALSRGIVLEDEVRECRYEKKRDPDSSLICILWRKGYLEEKKFIELLKMHSDRELRRALKRHLMLSPEGCLLFCTGYLFAFKGLPGF